MDYIDRIHLEQAAMIKALQELIAIPSVKGDPVTEGAPFGPEIERALAYVMTWGKQNGFTTKNLSGYAGHLEYGSGEKTVGVLVH